jgi:glycerophosphoryl diester phosphodiesterase
MPESPAIIAHRGACGYLPEHTLASKALAHAMGADFLEQDVVATRDSVPLVLHDIYLEHVTNVEHVFPERKRDDGHYYVVDFDLDEIRELGISERRHPEQDRALFPNRFPRGTVTFPIATLEEELLFIEGLNRSTGRSVSIYPEIKEPEWHFQHNIDLAHSLLTMLESFGYRGPDDGAIVQCFDFNELRRVRREMGCRLRLTQLLGPEDDTAEMALREIAEYADGVGLPYTNLLSARAEGGGQAEITAAAARIRRSGLFLHPYTFRKDLLPSYVGSAEELLQLLFADVRVDGLFCDHPDVAVAVRDRLDVDSNEQTA